MAETTAQEPTMEEILASIRRIISEDDAPAADAKPAETAAEPAAEVEDEFEAETEFETAAAEPEPAPVDDDVLDLTEKFEPEPAASAPVHSLGDLDVFSAPEPEPAPAPAPAPPPIAYEPPPRAPAPAPVAPAAAYDSLLSDSIAGQAASSFGKLARTVAMPAEGRDLEAVVRDLLRPMLKDWLDENLPAIVEAQVAAEVERISRLR